MTKNIYQKLIEVRKAVPYLQKSSQGHQYQYVGSSAVLGALRDKLDEQGLVLFPKVLDAKTSIHTVENKDKYGNLKASSTYFTELTMEFMWVDAETSESITIPFYAQGIDTGGEKGVGKALTYAEKYFLLKQFNIPTDQDDPDSFQNKIENSTPNFISEEQAAELKGYAGELSNLRNIPVEGVFAAMSITNVEKLPQEAYLQVRNGMIAMLEKAKAKSQQQPTGQNPSNGQQPNNQPPVNGPAQGVEPQGMPQQQAASDSFMLNRIERGTSPNGMNFAKLHVTPSGMNSEIIVFANTPETLNLVAGLQENTPVSMQIRKENGWYFLVGVGGVANAS